MSTKALGISIVIGAALGNRYFSTFDNAEKRAFKLGQAFKQTNKKLDASRQVIAWQNKLKQLQQFQGNFGQSSEKMQRRIAAVGMELEQAKRKAREYGLSIGNIVREERRLSRASQTLEKNLQRSRNAMQAKDRLSALRGKVLGAAGLAYGAGNIVGHAMDLQRDKIRLETVINADDGNAKAAVLRTVTQIKKTARETLASEKDLFGINYALNSAGLSESAARAGAVVVHKLATVTGGVSEQVGEIVGTVFNNMGQQIKGSNVEQKLSRIGDILAKTQLKYQIRDFSQLGESMKYAAASAVMNKVSLEQTAAALGMLNSAGLEGSMAGTAFAAVMRQMNKATKELGVTIVRDAKGNMDFAGTLDNIKQKLATYDNIDQRNSVIQRLFGDEGARGLIPLLGGLDKLKSGITELDQATGVVDKKYDLFKRSAAGQWQMLGQNIGMVGTTLATTFLPALNTVMKPLVKLTGWIATAAEKYPILGNIIGGLTVGFAGYVAILGTVTAAQWLYNTAAIATTNAVIGNAAAFVWSKSIMMGAVVWTKAVTAAQWLWNAALTANPIGLVIAGVAAFGVLAFTVYKKWEPIKAFFKDLWGTVGQVVSSVTSFFGGEQDGQPKGSRKSRRQAQAAAVISGALATTPAAVANTPTQINNTMHITQMAGEDSEALARRIIELQRETQLREEADVR